LLAELVVHGRGYEPVIVVGSTMSLVARSMIGISPEVRASIRPFCKNEANFKFFQFMIP
jgi:hypothetical protein